MSIEKETLVDQITITENGTIFYRETTKITEDGNLLSQTYHRTSVFPGQNLEEVPEKVVIIANVVWTPEVIQTYRG